MLPMPDSTTYLSSHRPLDTCTYDNTVMSMLARYGLYHFFAFRNPFRNRLRTDLYPQPCDTDVVDSVKTRTALAVRFG